MFKKISTIIAGIGLAALVVAAVVAIQVQSGDASARAGSGYGGGNGDPGSGSVATYVAPDTTTPLTAAEADGLAFMREEEKLAHDAYVSFAASYDSRVFRNISNSETQHTTTVQEYLDAFSIADPAAGRAAGSFADADLQALYDKVIAEGKASLEDALRMGVAIEQRDIADLQARIDGTDRADLKAMYENLLRASENHLAAFTRQLDGTAGGLGAGAGAGQGQGQGAGAGQGQGAGQGGCWE